MHCYEQERNQQSAASANALARPFGVTRGPLTVTLCTLRTSKFSCYTYEASCSQLSSFEVPVAPQSRSNPQGSPWSMRPQIKSQWSSSRDHRTSCGPGGQKGVEQPCWLSCPPDCLGSSWLIIALMVFSLSCHC